MLMSTSYQQHPLLSLLNPLSPFLMITLELFLKKHNNGGMPKVFNTKGRQMVIVEDSLNLPKIYISSKIKALTSAEQLKDKFVVPAHPYKPGTEEPNLEIDILIVCDTSMSLAF